MLIHETYIDSKQKIRISYCYYLNEQVTLMREIFYKVAQEFGFFLICVYYVCETLSIMKSMKKINSLRKPLSYF